MSMIMKNKRIDTCECNYHLGLGPNLQCPVHGADTCRHFGIEPYGRAVKEFVEDCWILYGRRIGLLYIGRCVYHAAGTAGGVDFDYETSVNPRVLGWYHTHPGKHFTTPSSIDEKTMRSWVKANGREMLCGIRCGDEQKCYRFFRSSSNSRGIVFSRLFSILIGDFFIGFKTWDYNLSV